MLHVPNSYVLQPGDRVVFVRRRGRKGAGEARTVFYGSDGYDLLDPKSKASQTVRKWIDNLPKGAALFWRPPRRSWVVVIPASEVEGIEFDYGMRFVEWVLVGMGRAKSEQLVIKQGGSEMTAIGFVRASSTDGDVKRQRNEIESWVTSVHIEMWVKDTGKSANTNDQVPHPPNRSLDELD